MNVTRIGGVAFMKNIIDAHAHVGSHSKKTYTKEQLDVFVKSELPNKDKVEKILVSDLDVLHSLTNEYEGNKSTLELFSNTDKYSVFASCSPKDGNVENIKRLYKEFPNRFVGLKFHPTFQNLDVLNEKYVSYMDFASKNNIPCLFHCAVFVDDKGKLIQDKIEVSDPSKLYKLAKKYPKTPVVMAHLGAGWEESHNKTIDVLIDSIKKGDANLYADISWVDIGWERNKSDFKNSEHRAKDHIIKAIKRLKGIGEKDWKYGDQSFRLMFGSDAPLDRFSGECALEEYTAFIEDIKYAIRKDKDLAKESEKIIDDLFYNNAKKLYLPQPKKNGINKLAIFSIVATLGLMIAGLVKYLSSQNLVSNSK